MFDPDSLNVWHENTLVGYLWRDKRGLISFRYDREWLQKGGFAISLKLPLTAEEYAGDTDGIAHDFFANLLPEGNAREQIVRSLKISDTDFDLLRAIGGECAGALSILPIESDPETNFEYTELSTQELHQLIKRYGQIVYNEEQAQDRPRLSLAGAQNKCPVLLKDNKYYLPKREAPSSHILKFEIRDFPHIPAYETFTIDLARKTGLPVVDIRLCNAGKDFYTEIVRYDRIRDNDGRIHRLHQEDFCQALGYSHAKKYQKDGGPSFAACFELVRDISTDVVKDTENLLRWLVFNFLAGNSDGHAKNLSFLYKDHEHIVLAPFYDLVCTRAIKRMNVNLAFSVGDQTNPGNITRDHWIALAKQCDIKKDFLLHILKETAEKLSEQINIEKENFENEHGEYPAIQRIVQVVHSQCHRTLKELRNTKAVK